MNKTAVAVVAVVVAAAGGAAYWFLGRPAEPPRDVVRETLAKLPPSWKSGVTEVTYGDEGTVTVRGLSFENPALAAEVQAGKIPEPPKDFTADALLSFYTKFLPYGVTVERVTVDGLKAENVDKVVDPQAYKNGQAAPEWLPVAEKVTFHNVSLKQWGSTTTMAEVALVNPALRQLSFVPTTENFATLPPLKVGAAVMQAIKIDRIEIKAAKQDLDVTDPQTQVRVQMALEMGDHVYEGIEGGNMRAYRGGPMSTTMTPPPNSGMPGAFTMKMGTTVGRDLNLSKLVNELARTGEFSTDMLKQQNLVSFGEATIQGLEFGMVPGFSIKIGSYTFGEFGHYGFIPTSFAFGMNDLELDLTQMLAMKPDKELQSFVDLGYDKVALSFGMAFAVDAETGDFDLKKFGFSGRNMGEASLTAKMGGIPVKQIVENPQAAQAAMATLVFRGAELTYKDQSILPKALEIAARQQGTTKDALVEQAIAQLQGMRATMFAQAPTVQAAIDQVVVFLKDPKSIRITLNPPSPVPVLAFMGFGADPERAAKTLGLSVVANQ